MNTALRIVVPVALLLAALVAVLLARAPLWLPLAYLALGGTSMLVYWFDKRAARNQQWRVPESRLHWVDLIGGIAGGLMAQALLRHKTRKPGFAAVSWTIAALHLAGLGALDLGLWTIPSI